MKSLSCGRQLRRSSSSLSPVTHGAVRAGCLSATLSLQRRCSSLNARRERRPFSAHASLLLAPRLFEPAPLPFASAAAFASPWQQRPARSPFRGRWRRSLPRMPKALACGSVTVMSLASSASVLLASSGSLLSLAPATSCAQPGGQPDALPAMPAGSLRASRSGRRLPLRWAPPST